MTDGFIKVAAATPKIKVAECNYNSTKIIEMIDKADTKKVKILVFPELSITGYTCRDLFFQQQLLDKAYNSLLRIISSTVGKDILVFVGLPVQYKSKIYNCAAVIKGGKLLALIPKTYLPNHNEFNEKRYFETYNSNNDTYKYDCGECLFGNKIILNNTSISNLKIGVEICEDLWGICPKSTKDALCGASIICNLSASDELVSKSDYRRDLIRIQSSKTLCGYIYCDAGEGESTTDMVFAGHNLIVENGNVLNESELFSNSMIISEIDVNKLSLERNRNTSFSCSFHDDYDYIDFDFSLENTDLTRSFSRFPFVPSSSSYETLESILKIQTRGLKTRLEHTKAKKIILGVSGGLDSTLALIVANRTLCELNRPLSDIIAITMPCFGTTGRTYNNAVSMIKHMGATLREINIEDAVLQHFKDIGHDKNVTDVTYENSQARIRTLVLMDTANKENGIVLGTGDLSELALGFATYSGDHISMYNVNSSIPKTLIKHLIRFECTKLQNREVIDVLNDILDTPVSPELLPANGDNISQITEDLVGPYELHDFFLYYCVRQCFSPKKILRLAKYTFKGIYDNETILKWLKVFYRRFFSQQFKRSCMPDGPKVGSVSLSPRGDFRMPSDASVNIWLEDLESL